VPYEVAKDLARRMQLMSKCEEIRDAMDTSALAMGTDAATAKPLSCSTCGKPPAPGAALSACGRCKTALYCSKACQTEAWPGHKHVCKAVGEAVAKAERKAGPWADREAALDALPSVSFVWKLSARRAARSSVATGEPPAVVWRPASRPQ
jgi:hypothetical protein